jgi:polar amino acid transport system substrate-binding protein
MKVSGIDSGVVLLPRFAAAVLAIILVGCDDPKFPRDPDGTFEAVLASGIMTVAAVHHPPWVDTEDEVPSGAEVALIEEFAEELGVTVEWRDVSAFIALDALEQGEVDLAIGGFTQEELEPYAGAAPTYAYFTSKLVLAAPPGADVPTDLEGLSVLVPPSVTASKLVHDEGGLVVEKTGLETRIDAVAIPRWQLEERGLVPTSIGLRQSKHVMAVPQGENAWIMELERYLRRASVGMPERLREYQP